MSLIITIQIVVPHTRGVWELDNCLSRWLWWQHRYLTGDSNYWLQVLGRKWSRLWRVDGFNFWTIDETQNFSEYDGLVSSRPKNHSWSCRHWSHAGPWGGLPQYFQSVWRYLVKVECSCLGCGYWFCEKVRAVFRSPRLGVDWSVPDIASAEAYVIDCKTKTISKVTPK